MGDRGLRPLRQKDADALASPEALGEEQVGEAVGRLRDVAEGMAHQLPALGRMDQRRAVAMPGRDMLVDGVEADVVALRDAPAEGLAELLIAPGGMQHRLLLDQPRAVMPGRRRRA